MIWFQPGGGERPPPVPSLEHDENPIGLGPLRPFAVQVGGDAGEEARRHRDETLVAALALGDEHPTPADPQVLQAQGQHLAAPQAAQDHGLDHRPVPGGAQGGDEGVDLGRLQDSWRGALDDDEVVELTRARGGRTEVGWWEKIRPHSLGWVTARDREGRLVGFANVAWDGGDHAFLLDPKVRPEHHRVGIGTEVVRRATEGAREAGCEWLHVDFDEELAPFYLEACRSHRHRRG